MTSQNFLEKFRELFEEEDVTQINLDTHFKNINEWNSMVALYLIAMADEEYSITLTGSDIRNSVTVEDLFNLVHSKAA
jgi:acyl carrier protein